MFQVAAGATNRDCGQSFSELTETRLPFDEPVSWVPGLESLLGKAI